MRERKPRAAGLVVAALLLGLQSGLAHAYVREVTGQGVPVAWHTPCIRMQLYLGSPPPVLTAADYFAVSTQAAAVWSYPSLACTDIRLSVTAESQPSADVGYDHRNVIVFRQDRWCRQLAPGADAGADDYCYSPSMLAVTSIFKNAQTGEILDADIELNAVDFTWGDRVGQPALATSTTMDFQYALTHELGHVIGLDHPCYDGSEARLNDNTGAPELDCYDNPSLPGAVAQTMMYPSVDFTGDKTKQRSLSPDDQQGDCDIYPHVHEVCPAPPAQGGCGVAPLKKPAPGHAAGLGCCWLALVLLAAACAARARPKG